DALPIFFLPELWNQIFLKRSLNDLTVGILPPDLILLQPFISKILEEWRIGFRLHFLPNCFQFFDHAAIWEEFTVLKGAVLNRFFDFVQHSFKFLTIGWRVLQQSLFPATHPQILEIKEQISSATPGPNTSHDTPRLCSSESCPPLRNNDTFRLQSPPRCTALCGHQTAGCNESLQTELGP